MVLRNRTLDLMGFGKPEPIPFSLIRAHLLAHIPEGVGGACLAVRPCALRGGSRSRLRPKSRLTAVGLRHARLRASVRERQTMLPCLRAAVIIVCAEEQSAVPPPVKTCHRQLFTALRGDES